MIGPWILHFFAAVIAVVLSSMGTAIGQGIAGFGVLNAMSRQPTGIHQGLKATLIGLALTESGGILSLVVALISLFAVFPTMTWAIGWAELGIGLALGLSAAAVGIASGFAVNAASSSIFRQPFFSQKIVTLMLLMQSMIEAPVIFAFIIALLIRVSITTELALVEGIKLCAAGVVIGIGSIGPSIGKALFAHASCTAVGLNRKAYNRIFAFSLLSQAIVETPVIFCLLVSTLLIFRPITDVNPIFSVMSAWGAIVAMGLGAIGTGIGTGYVASKSCKQIALVERSYGPVFRSTLLAQVFIESSAIYALIVALLLAMKVV